jgi:hypothetical protein
MHNDFSCSFPATHLRSRVPNAGDKAAPKVLFALSHEAGIGPRRPGFALKLNPAEFQIDVDHDEGKVPVRRLLGSAKVVHPELNADMFPQASGRGPVWKNEQEFEMEEMCKRLK